MFGQVDNDYEGRFYARETERVVVKNLSVIELKGRFPTWLNDPVVCAYSRYRNRHMSIDDIKHYVESLSNDSTSLVWACYCKETGKHIANVSLENISYENASAGLDCLIGEKEYWGEGYGREICALMIEHGFEELGLHRIYSSVPKGHPSMNRLAQNLGFVEEGIRRQAWRLDGQYQDVVEYGILKEEYENTGG